VKGLECYPDTDALYVEIRPGHTVGGRDADDDLVIHYGEDGRRRDAGARAERSDRERRSASARSV
jgi:hypothetical protein